MRFEYPVFAFRQQREAPIQVTFVAHAMEVLQWVGVPRKSDELLTGYQRFRDNVRIDGEIVPFFQDPRNCSPTAVIVALHKDTTLASCKLADENITPERGVVPTKLVIEFDEEALAGDGVFKAALEFVNKRLPSSGSGASPPETEDDDDTSDEQGGDADDDDESSVHLGSATLMQMKRLLEDEKNWEGAAFREAITDFVKPGVLIDGQHRITAAARVGKGGLPFIICGLYDAEWPEQVFQFTVVNLKPKKIPPSVITSIAALSLTSAEQKTVEHRLKQAGVKMREVKLMGLVAYDEFSPFADMVDMAVGDPSNRAHKLGYQAIKRVANVWYRCKHVPLVIIAKSLFATTSEKIARLEWREQDLWYVFFRAFWDTVRGAYSPDLWVKGSTNRLMIGANLWALQEAVLGDVPTMASIWNLGPIDETVEVEEAFRRRQETLISRLKEAVRETVGYFPQEMWTRRWAKAEQDTKQGRADLIKLFKEFIDQGKTTGGKWKGWKSKEDWFGKDSTSAV